MNSDTRSNLKDRAIWARILYMIFFAVAYSIAEMLIWLVALFQAVVVLVTGSANEAMLRFGHNLSRYIYQIVQFETFNDERLAFPFSDWPDEMPPADSAYRPSAQSEPGSAAEAGAGTDANMGPGAETDVSASTAVSPKPADGPTGDGPTGDDTEDASPRPDRPL